MFLYIVWPKCPRSWVSRTQNNPENVKTMIFSLNNHDCNAYSWSLNTRILWKSLKTSILFLLFCFFKRLKEFLPTKQYFRSIFKSIISRMKQFFDWRLQSGFAFSCNYYQALLFTNQTLNVMQGSRSVLF